MKVNQRYFALRDGKGNPAPNFAFVSQHIETEDDGATIIAGNERVLRARLSDARHFWDAGSPLRLALYRTTKKTGEHYLSLQKSARKGIVQKKSDA